MFEFFPEFLVVNYEKNEEAEFYETYDICDRDKYVKYLNGFLLIAAHSQHKSHDAHHNIEERKPRHIHTNYFSFLHFTPSKALAPRHMLLKVHKGKDSQHHENN